MLKHKPIAQSNAGGKNTTCRFARLGLASDKKAILCRLTNGAFYELPVDAFSAAEDWDGTGANAVDIIDGGYGALLVLQSGKRIDFATDFVLHHCEPAYAYHRTKVKPSRLGARIREIRQAKGLSMNQVEKKTGIKQPNLSRLESDKHVPSIETLTIIAKALGVSVAELMGSALQVAG